MVNRYCVSDDGVYGCGMDPDPTGDYVSYEDYEAALKDAERYRWLRDAHDCDWHRLLRDGGEEMDANIDAEMAKQSRAPQSREGSE